MNTNVSVSVDDLELILKASHPTEEIWEPYRRLVATVHRKRTGRPPPVWFVSTGDRKIDVIKAIRTVTGLGLSESKRFSELPTTPPANLRSPLDIGMHIPLVLTEKQIKALVPLMEAAGARFSRTKPLG